MAESTELTVPRMSAHGIVLRPFAAGDADAVREASSDPAITDVTTVPAAADHGLAEDWLMRQHERAATGVGYSFAIEVGGECVGQIGLWLRERDQGRATIGYWIRRSRRRRGHALSALQTITEWAWSVPEIHRLQLHIDPVNVGSLRTAERAGYTGEGLLRSWQRIVHERRDMFVYSRLRSEPMTAQGRGVPGP